MQSRIFAVFITLPLIAAAADDAAEIMVKVAANVQQSAGARRLYVYHQKVTSSLVRSSGEIARKEKREYDVFPTGTETDKKLVSFHGEYRKGKDAIAYSEPGYKYKDLDLDGDLISGLTDDLVNEKGSRDGIPHSLFPLRAKDLPGYKFTMGQEFEYQGRRTYKILFEPGRKNPSCISIGDGGDDECDHPIWKGEAWIDAAELQPVRIDTNQAFRIPWGVRAFLGVNVQQTGFSLLYRRLAENVWFPVSYGTEFRLKVLFGYKRTVTLSLVSDGFQKTDADSKIQYDVARQEP